MFDKCLQQQGEVQWFCVVQSLHENPRQLIAVAHDHLVTFQSTGMSDAGVALVRNDHSL